MKIKKRIEIIRSTVTSNGSLSAESALRIQELLEKHYEHVGISIVNNSVDLEVITRSNPDLVYLGTKRIVSGKPETKSYSEIWLAEYFENLNIRFTGSQIVAIRHDHNKVEAKLLAQEAGIPTAPHFITYLDQYKSSAQLPLTYPLFVKARHKGTQTVGEDSVVRSFGHYKKKLAALSGFDQKEMLVETYLAGRQFTVAILDTFIAGEPMLMPVELVIESNKAGDTILNQETVVIKNINDKILKNEVCSMALKIYQLLGGRDTGRIDIRTDESGVAHFLEAHFTPDIDANLYAGAAKITKDIDFETILLKVIALGLNRRMTVAAPTLSS